MENNMDNMVRGDLSVPDDVVSNKTKFIAVAVIVFVVAVSIITVIKIGTSPQDKAFTAGDIENSDDVISTAPKIKKIISESEKVKILNSLSVPTTNRAGTTRTESPSAESGNTESAEIVNEKKRILESLSGESSGPTLTPEEKLKILGSF